MDKMNTEQWLLQQYKSLSEMDKSKGAFVSIKIKRYRTICNKYGRQAGDELVNLIYDTILHWLNGVGFVAHSCLSSFYVLYLDALNQCKEDVVRKFDALEDIIATIADDRFRGNVHCGYGVCFLEKNMEFADAQYRAEVCRAESADKGQWVSHLEIYGVTFFEEFTELNVSLQKAFMNNELQMFLQPKVDLKSGKITEAEALIRWIDPVLGQRPLTSFLPLLEEAGTINYIDFFIFAKACETIERWIKKYEKKIKISVNFSKRSFNYPFFLKEFTDIFEQYNCPTDCLEFELLESIVLNKTERVMAVVNEIRSYGFSCALDDFGSGYSSFDVLIDTNLSAIKIDRSLFRDENNKREKLVISHIIQTAHGLGMKTVAEGVETRGYVQCLRELGCDAVQGYVFYKPMPAEEFEMRFVKGHEAISF